MAAPKRPQDCKDSPRAPKQASVGGGDPDGEYATRCGLEIKVNDNIWSDRRVCALMDSCIIPALVEKFLRERKMLSHAGAAPQSEEQK